MFARWLHRFRLRRDVRRILRELPPEDRARLRATPECELIGFHLGFGMGLRNGFRHGEFPGLLRHCLRAVERSGEPMSFDALSSAAIRELWRSLQPGP